LCRCRNVGGESGTGPYVPHLTGRSLAIITAAQDFTDRTDTLSHLITRTTRPRTKPRLSSQGPRIVRVRILTAYAPARPPFSSNSRHRVLSNLIRPCGTFDGSTRKIWDTAAGRARRVPGLRGRHVVSAMRGVSCMTEYEDGVFRLVWLRGAPTTDDQFHRGLGLCSGHRHLKEFVTSIGVSNR